jgi:hypothetical protein
MGLAVLTNYYKYRKSPLGRTIFIFPIKGGLRAVIAIGANHQSTFAMEI